MQVGDRGVIYRLHAVYRGPGLPPVLHVDPGGPPGRFRRRASLVRQVHLFICHLRILRENCRRGRRTNTCCTIFWNFFHDFPMCTNLGKSYFFNRYGKKKLPITIIKLKILITIYLEQLET